MYKFLLFFGMSFSIFSSAAYASSPFAGDCADGNNDQLLKMMSDALKADIHALGAKYGISFVDSSIELPLDVGPDNDDSNPKKIYMLFRLQVGSVNSADGTTFDLYFDGGQEEFSNYTETPTYNGFDKEGNAINGHCSLKLSPIVQDYLPYETTFVIRNHKTGRTIGTFPLPASFRLY